MREKTREKERGEGPNRVTTYLPASKLLSREARPGRALAILPSQEDIPVISGESRLRLFFPYYSRRVCSILQASLLRRLNLLLIENKSAGAKARVLSERLS